MNLKLIFIASDHAGFDLKESIKKHVNKLKFHDLGAFSQDPVDYPDYAANMAKALKDNVNSFGILICGSGIGMDIAANRYQHLRAALCRDNLEAELARKHNNANVLVLGSKITNADKAYEVLSTFLNTQFENGRHSKRLKKLAIDSKPFNNTLSDYDPEIADAINKELYRQQNTIELIASENFVSRNVLAVQGSVLTNKYAEGYSGKRYYGGCEFVDIAEDLAIKRVKELYNAGFANVQPHSGSQANQAAFMAMMSPGDTFLAMSLNEGGHLTHGSKVNQSGKWFNAVHYGVNEKTGLIDMAMVEKLALEHKPKVIIAGGSAYPRTIDFAVFRKIADSIGAYFMVDMAHFSGLVAGGVFPSPMQHAHIVTSTTHKTLRGPRGGIILTNDEVLAKKIDSAIFPGMQGGPLMHVIAAKAVAFKEALEPDFKLYAKQVVENAKALASTLQERKFTIFTGGTDSHLLLVDLRPQKLTGKIAEAVLEKAGLTCNKNSIPFDTEKPFITSGIRLGSPACTTRGFGIKEFKIVGNLIADVLDNLVDGSLKVEVELKIKEAVKNLCEEFPLYKDQ